MTLKSQGHRSKWHLTLKTDLRPKNRHPKCFSSKVKVKEDFSIMMDNVMRSRTSHAQTIQDIVLIYLKAFTQGTLY